MFPLALPRKANETLQVLERISGIPGISSTIPFRQPRRERCKISPPPPPPPPTFDITPRFIYLRPPPIKSIEIESIVDTLLPRFFIFLLYNELLFPPPSPLSTMSTTFGRFVLSSSPLLPNNRLYFLLSQLFTLPLPELFHFLNREREKERE